MRIVIPGGSGFCGRALTRFFLAGGHDVTVLSRSGTAEVPGSRALTWNGRSLGEWASSIDGADAIVNLAGRSVNCRYDDENKKQIMESRTESTRVLGEAIGRATVKPKVWLNMSTATIYRSATDHAQDEETGNIGSTEGPWGFSIQVATAWERTVNEMDTPGVRKVAMRTAMVMGKEEGGPFAVMLGLVRKGLGGPLGPGSQMMSWVHERDFCRAVEFLAFQSDLSGPVNIASPRPLPNRVFMKTLREVAGVKIGLPAYRWMVNLGAVFMKTEPELVLKSRWVVPTRMLKAGFKFEFEDWTSAARDLVS